MTNGQIAPGWLAQTGCYSDATDAASKAITGYAEAPDGQLSLLRGDGVSASTRDR